MASVSPYLLQELSSLGRFETLPVGARAARQGVPHTSLSLIVKGKLAVNCHANGETVQLGVLSIGQTVGEMSVIDHNKASADVTVVSEPARLWTIRSEDFDAFVSKYPREGVNLLRAVAADLSRRVRSDSAMLLRQAEENRHRFLDMDY